MSSFIDNPVFHTGVEVGITVGTFVWLVIQKFIKSKLLESFGITVVLFIAKVAGQEAVEYYVKRHLEHKRH